MSETIGDNCSIGPYTAILASGHDWSDPDTPVLLQGRSIGNITIEDNVWIGAHVTVMDGVTIGANSVVSANSVVTHDLPPYSVAAGQPARVVSYRKDVSQESQSDDAVDGVQKRDNGAGVQKEPLREPDRMRMRNAKK